ncbi:hypothetical protein QR680_015947 [Steinernema hermaphroditum]|uniref:Hexosyltransferase n=1 Tax=Steinernema hermaphroditum TaxID=289476 RepID=A0AA39H9H9_9BILA|nr:hypothetical protein QR680_015947 [Steinernema hermaphroditum]
MKAPSSRVRQFCASRWGKLIAVLLVVDFFFLVYWRLLCCRNVTKYRISLSGVSVNATFANLQLDYIFAPEFDPRRCDDKKLFIFVMTMASLFDQRDEIRNTWAAERHVHAGYYIHNAYCPHVPYVLRADDDIVAFPERFIHFINTGFYGNEEKAIYGILVKSAGPVRDPSHKWYIPVNYYNSSSYPTYVNGPAYLMTAASTRAILERTAETTFFWIEDVMFTGLMAERTGVKVIESLRTFRFYCDAYDMDKTSEFYATLCMVFWYAYCIANLILAINRLLEFLSPRLSTILFKGDRPFFWIAVIGIYALALCALSPHPFYFYDTDAGVWYFFWLGEDSVRLTVNGLSALVAFHDYRRAVKRGLFWLVTPALKVLKIAVPSTESTLFEKSTKVSPTHHTVTNAV